MSYQRGTQWGLDSVREARDWRLLSPCGEDPERMWPLPNDQVGIADARRVCDRCPLEVRHQCLQDGIDTREWDSVRAGFTGKERRDRYRQGFAIADYPPPVPAVRWCQRCRGSFPFDPRHPYARLCAGCDKRHAKPTAVSHG